MTEYWLQLCLRLKLETYITGYIKSMLRRKNRLMRRDRVEEASALAQRIGKEITRRTKTQLKPIQGNVDSGKMWACVRRLTGKKLHDNHVEGISAESLNNNRYYYNHLLTLNMLPCY